MRVGFRRALIAACLIVAPACRQHAGAPAEGHAGERSGARSPGERAHEAPADGRSRGEARDHADDHESDRRREDDDADDAVDEREAPAPRFGTLMMETGRRFELLGRAVAAGEWDFAAYQAEELEELFGDDLPGARPPEDLSFKLGPAIEAMSEGAIEDLEAATQSRDRARFERAFAATATACNGCHAAAGRAFIVIPSALGAEVPTLPSTPAATARPATTTAPAPRSTATP